MPWGRSGDLSPAFMELVLAAQLPCTWVSCAVCHRDTDCCCLPKRRPHLRECLALPG